jgi:hypothetical protein
MFTSSKTSLTAEQDTFARGVRGVAASRSQQRSTRGWNALLMRAMALAVIVLVIFARIRLLHLPLERDEGEYAYNHPNTSSIRLRLR